MQPLHENLGSGGVGAHIDAHMAHDANEAQQYDGLAQETEASGKLMADGRSRSISIGWLLLMDGSGKEEQ